jgi:hypothetical protein
MAERRMRYWLTDVAIPTGFTEDVRAVLAELDRQRDLIAAVLAECDEAEKAPGVSTVRITAVVETIRALLGKEER